MRQPLELTVVSSVLIDYSMIVETVPAPTV